MQFVKSIPNEFFITPIANIDHFLMNCGAYDALKNHQKLPFGIRACSIFSKTVFMVFVIFTILFMPFRCFLLYFYPMKCVQSC
jgi:hypothetical protein